MINAAMTLQAAEPQLRTIGFRISDPAARRMRWVGTIILGLMLIGLALLWQQLLHKPTAILLYILPISTVGVMLWFLGWVSGYFNGLLEELTDIRAEQAAAVERERRQDEVIGRFAAVAEQLTFNMIRLQDRMAAANAVSNERDDAIEKHLGQIHEQLIKLTDQQPVAANGHLADADVLHLPTPRVREALERVAWKIVHEPPKPE